LQPATSLDNIVQRRELCALFKPKHLESITSSVNGLIESELELHNTLMEFSRILQKEDPEFFSMDFGEDGKKTRELAYVSLF
jgi:hypothetical protein